MSLVLYVINTMFWLHWMLNDFWIVERSLRKRKQFLLLFFFSGNKKPGGSWSDSINTLFIFFFLRHWWLASTGMWNTKRRWKWWKLPALFLPAFALRQNRVENFQLLRSDTARNASYVKSLRRLIYRCYTVVDKQLVIRVHVDCMGSSWALCMTWPHDKDRRTHAEMSKNV